MLAAGLGTLVTYNPTTVSPRTRLEDALLLMHRHDFHHLPVVDDARHVVGIISDLDLAQAASDISLSTTGRPILPPVADLMARHVVTIEEGCSARDALAALVENRVHSVPVVEAGELIGMVTSTDFLREFSYGEIDASSEPVVRYMSAARSEVSITASFPEVAARLRQFNTVCLPVMDGQDFAGVVCERDVHRALRFVLMRNISWSQEVDLSLDVAPHLSWLIADVPVPLHLTDTLCEAASRMVGRRTQALAVHSQTGNLVGILSEDDILAAQYDARD